MDRLRAQHNLRTGVWDRLRAVARPDSRLHYDFGQMHPDFEGSEAAAERFIGSELPQDPGLVFAAPDNALQSARAALLTRGCRIIVSTYCMRRGFRLLDPARIAPADIAYAASLDGLERFGEEVGLARIAALGRLDLALTGSAAVTSNGVRYGRSYQYFDIEWGIMTELGVADERTPVAVGGQEVQLTDDKSMPMPREAVRDYIGTSMRTIR
eukprot:gene22841-24123_t